MPKNLETKIQILVSSQIAAWVREGTRFVANCLVANWGVLWNAGEAPTAFTGRTRGQVVACRRCFGYAGGVCSGLALVGPPGGSLVRVSK